MVKHGRRHFELWSTNQRNARLLNSRVLFFSNNIVYLFKGPYLAFSSPVVFAAGATAEVYQFKFVWDSKHMEVSPMRSRRAEPSFAVESTFISQGHRKTQTLTAYALTI